MAGYLTTGDVNAATGAWITHFDTFKRDILIYKQGLPTLDTTRTQLHGYGNHSNALSSVSIVTGVYQGIVFYGNGTEIDKIITDLNTDVPKEQIKIKVGQDGADYIEDGTTEKLVIDGRAYNIVGNRKTQHFQGLKYYVYTIEQTR